MQAFVPTPTAWHSGRRWEHDALRSSRDLVDTLRAEVLLLRAKVASYTGEHSIPRARCSLAELELGAAKVLVEYERTPGEPATLDCPATPDDVDILAALINGAWVDAHDHLPDYVIERWSQHLLEN